MTPTALQETLGAAHGLAIAAATVVEKVDALTDDPALRHELAAMRRDADETRARCLDAERAFGEEVATEILAHANTVRDRASELAGTWLRAGTGPLAAWSFLAMGEAGEVAVWRELAALAPRAPGDLAELAAWALPLQEAHLETALAGAARLAELADPLAPGFR